MADKKVISGKVKKINNRKFKIEKGNNSETEVTVEIVEEGTYTVQKLSLTGLPAEMPDGKPILWFNNFAIKKGNDYINQRYRVTVSNLVDKLGKKGKLVIFDSNSKNNSPYYFTGKITNNTFELTDGDPGIGKT